MDGRSHRDDVDEASTSKATDHNVGPHFARGQPSRSILVLCIKAKPASRFQGNQDLEEKGGDEP